MNGIIAVYVLQGLVFGGFAGFIAGQKNRDALAWFLLGFLFSLLAILALVAVPNLSAEQAKIKPDVAVKKLSSKDGYILASKYAESTGQPVDVVLQKIRSGEIEGAAIDGYMYAKPINSTDK